MRNETQGFLHTLSGMDESIVQGAKAAGQDDERLGILDQHYLANEEMLELDELVQIRVRFLFAGQLDIAAET